MTPYDRAQRFVGEIRELPGAAHHPLIQWWHLLCALGSNQPDETPWCSSFVNGICWDLDLPRTKSAAARSWLTIGESVQLHAAAPGYDVVILQRGDGQQPGAHVIAAPGHVGFYAGQTPTEVFVLGGNQGNAVTVQGFPRSRVLGVRRLRQAGA